MGKGARASQPDSPRIANGGGKKGGRPTQPDAPGGNWASRMGTAPPGAANYARPAVHGWTNDDGSYEYAYPDQDPNYRPPVGSQPQQEANRGLLGQVEDAYAKPLDFGQLQNINVPGQGGRPGLRAPDFSNLPGVTTGRTPLVRERGDLATRLEGMFGDYQDRFDDLNRNFALTRPGDFGAERNRVEGAVYDRAYNRISPEMERQEQAMLTDLANRGLAPTSEAYRDMSGQFSDQRQRDLTDLSLASVLAGSQEHQRLADLASRNRGQMFGEAGDVYGIGAGNVGQLEGFNQAEEAEQHRQFQRELADRQQKAGEEVSAFDSSLATRKNFGNEANTRFGQEAQLRQQQIAEMMMKRGQPTRETPWRFSAPETPAARSSHSSPTTRSRLPTIWGLVGSNYARSGQ